MKTRQSNTSKKLLAAAFALTLMLTVGVAWGESTTDAIIPDNATTEQSEAATESETSSDGAVTASSSTTSNAAATSDASSSDDAAATSDASSSDEDEALPSNLKKYDLIEAPEISNAEMNELLVSSAAAAPISLLSASAADDIVDIPSEGDGSKIERISVEWITNDTQEDGDPDRLSLTPNGDNDFSVRMRLNIALSGQYDYEEGAIQISIPKSIFEDRTGKTTGKMTLSVPEAPDSKATFNYTDMGDYYLLTNTRKLSAATSAMFEFSVSGLCPHTIVDGVEGDNEPGYDDTYTSGVFEGTIQITTHSGKTIAKTSNQIDAAINTAEQVKSASKKSNAIYEGWPSSWPASLKPENDSDYIYVDWTTSARISGNQNFSMDVTENAKTSASTGTLLLGYKDVASGTIYKTTGSSTETLAATVFTNGYKKDGDQFYGHAYVAYHKANFEDNHVYTLDNSVTSAFPSTCKVTKY